MLARVEAHALTRTWGRRYALRNASFSLDAGTITAIIGANGAGKSTSFNILAGRISPTSGSVTFDGEPWRVDDERRRRACGYLSHASYLYGALSARENLALVRGLYRLESDDVDAVIARVGLSRAADRPVRQFSRGMVQRLSLARLLLSDPAVWLLDEPASGLDEAGMAWLRAEVSALAAAGKIVALSSHHRTMVANLATHAVALSRGRVAYAGPVESPEHVAELFAEHIG